MKKRICFVDDDPLEIVRFRSALKSDYDIGAGVTLDDALGDLKARFGSRKPDLFLLDMYFGPTMKEPTRSAIAKADVEVTEAEERIRKLLGRAGIVAKNGFDLAEKVKIQFRRSPVPTAFFSRKAFLDDALEAHKKGLPVVEKPDPKSDDNGTEEEQYTSAMRRSAKLLKEEFDGIISRSSWWYKNQSWLSGFASGFFFLFASFLWDALKEASTQARWGEALGCSLASIVFGFLAWKWR